MDFLSIGHGKRVHLRWTDCPQYERPSKEYCFITKRLQRCYSPESSAKTAATYSPTLYRSTIGVSELNFSVRNGKRWNLTAKTTLMSYIEHILQAIKSTLLISEYNSKSTSTSRESLGQLVMLGFDVTVFTPASYQRHRL